MSKKIEVAEGNKYEERYKELKEKLNEAHEELDAAKEKVAGVEDEIQELIEDYLNEKVVVAPVVVVEHHFPRNFWGWECWH